MRSPYHFYPSASLSVFILFLVRRLTGSPCCLSSYPPVSVSPLIFVRRLMRSPCCLSSYPFVSVSP
jgi:hypothetical protein